MLGQARSRQSASPLFQRGGAAPFPRPPKPPSLQAPAAPSASTAKGTQPPEPTSHGRRTLVPYTPPPGNVETRASALLDWLTRRLGIHACFVSDENGLALVQRDATLEHLAMAAALVRVVDEVDRLTSHRDGSVCLALDEDNLLTCVIRPTDFGRLALGLIGPDKPSEAQLKVVGTALEHTFLKEETR